MKKILVFLLMILAGGLVHADPYGYGETVPIPFVSIDTATGEPVAATLIKIAIYYQSSTTAVVAETDMSNWNSQTGEYYYNFTTPDSSGVYTPRVRWQAQGAEYILWLDNIYVAEIFDIDNDAIVIQDTTASGKEIAVMPGDWTAADTAAFQGAASGLDSNKVAQALTDVLSDTVAVNVAKISGSLAAANNTKSFFTGTGHTDGVVLSAKRLSLVNNDANAAFYVYNTGGTAAKFYTDHAASGENWSYGLALLSGAGQSAPLRILGAGSYTGAYGNLQGSVTSVTNKVTVVDSTAGDVSYLANAGISSLATATDMAKSLDSLGKVLDSVYAILDTLQNHDDWIALQSDMTKSLDSLGAALSYSRVIQDTSFAILDSIQLYLDAAISGISSGSSNWSDGQRDSVLAALTNASFLAKIWNISFATAFTAGSVGDSLTTPAYVQGAAAGLTAADIWAHATRTINGGYIDSNKTEQGGSAGGDGTYSWSVLVIDTSSGGTIAVQQAKISINNLTQSGVPYHDLTDNTGLANGFNLDAGTWVVIFNEPGYKSIIDTITVSAIGADTIYTYTSNANKTVVFGTLMDSRGQYAAYGRVKFKAVPYPGDSLIYKGDTVVTQTIVEDTANAYGYVSIPLIANANYTSPDSTYYQVSIYNRYGQLLERPFYCIVPDTTSIAITDLTKWRR